MSEKTLRICHLYPDLLNLYGDRGNILCMRRRLEWRGIDAEVTEVTVGEQADFTQFDLFFIGGGQDFEQEVLLSDLKAGKGGEIKAAIADGKTFLTICGGYQMLGSYYRTWDGKQCDFIGAIDYYTVGSKERMIGNFLFECLPKSGGSTVVGFENHSGKTEVEGEDVEKALVYDLSSSRMFETKDDNKSRAADGSSQYDDKRIVITDKRINKVIFNHSLPWFLSLCASDRYGKDWSDQQYLDRQDHYTLVFYVPAPSSTYSMDARIKVNNWVLNLQNADLGK